MAWMKIATTNEFEGNEHMLPITIEDEYLVLFNIDGTYYVTSNICTHRNQLLTNGSLDGEVVNCPRHGGKFDVKTGKPLGGPCFTSLKTFEVDIRNEDEVWINY